MKEQTIQLFTEKEEEFVNLLIEIGTKKTVAQMLVFLANTPKATSRDLERGTDLRQPEVSIAIKYLAGQGWINTGEAPSQHKGRHQKIYSLAVPIKQIVTAIEKAKKDEAANRLALVKKIRDFI
jgi:predicted transcriptional regulator